MRTLLVVLGLFVFLATPLQASSVEFVAGGKKIIGAFGDKILIWDSARPSAPRILLSSGIEFYDFIANPAGDRVIALPSYSEDSSIYIDVDRERVSNRPKLPQVSSRLYLSDKADYLYGYYDSGCRYQYYACVIRISTKTGEITKVFSIPSDLDPGPSGNKWIVLNDNLYSSISEETGIVSLYNYKTSKRELLPRCKNDDPYFVYDNDNFFASSGGRFIAVHCQSSDHSPLSLLDTKSGDVTAVVKDRRDIFTFFSNDGSYLISFYTEDHRYDVINPKNGKTLSRVDLPRDKSMRVLTASSDKLLIYSSKGKKPAYGVYDLFTGNLLGTLKTE